MRSLNLALAAVEQPDPIESAVAEAARLLASGEVAEAAAGIERVKTADPRNKNLRFLLALVAWRMHDLASATEILRALCEDEPNNGTFADTLGTLRAMVGDLQDALFLGKLAHALPTDPVALSFLPPDFPSFADAFLSIQERPLVRVAKALAHQGRLQQATRALQQHVQLFADDVEAASELTQILLATGREAEAIQHIGPLIGTGDPRALSLVARASAAIGDRDGAARLHDAVTDAAPDAADLSAHRIRDRLGASMDEVADWMARFSFPRSGRKLPPRSPKIRIGYMVAGVAGSPFASMVRLVVRKHDREATEVYGYGFGELNADCNASLRGGFDTWRDISKIDPRTIARILEGDGLDIVVDASGFWHPASLRALSATEVPLRCSWLGMPVVARHGAHDAVLTPKGATTISEQQDASIANPVYPVVGGAIQRRANPDGRPVIGADVMPRELTSDTAAFLAAILRAVPDAQLALRDHGLSNPIVSDRLIAQLGDLAARVEIVKSVDARDFLELIDLAVVPASVEEARPAVEAMAHGVPVVIVNGSGASEKARAVAEQLGLEPMVAGSSADAVELIARLATDPSALDKAWTASGAIASCPDFFDGTRIASAIAALVPARKERPHAG